MRSYLDIDSGNPDSGAPPARRVAYIPDDMADPPDASGIRRNLTDAKNGPNVTETRNLILILAQILRPTGLDPRAASLPPHLIWVSGSSRHLADAKNGIDSAGNCDFS